MPERAVFRKRTEYEISFGRSMSAWVRGGHGSRSRRAKWHQAEWDSRTGEAVLRCSGRVVHRDARDVMDYRWRPPARDRCRQPECQQEVAP